MHDQLVAQGFSLLRVWCSRRPSNRPFSAWRWHQLVRFSAASFPVGAAPPGPWCGLVAWSLTRPCPPVLLFSCESSAASISDRRLVAAIFGWLVLARGDLLLRGGVAMRHVLSFDDCLVARSLVFSFSHFVFSPLLCLPLSLLLSYTRMLPWPEKELASGARGPPR